METWVNMEKVRKALVVSRYNEDVSKWLLPSYFEDYEIYIYNKGKQDILYHKQIDNVGRESHTYLYFIINHYSNLPDYTIFLQGDAPDHLLQEEWTNLKTNTFKLEDYKGMGHHIFEVTGTSIPNHVIQEFPIYRKTPDFLYNHFLKKESNDIKHIKYSMNAEACFCVSKNNILRHPKEVYINLYNEHYNPIHAKRPGTIVQYAGTMEYSWHLIFDNIYYKNC